MNFLKMVYLELELSQEKITSTAYSKHLIKQERSAQADVFPRVT